MVGMEVSDLAQTLLHTRGITEAGEVEKFLKPDFAHDMHDPALLFLFLSVARPGLATDLGEVSGDWLNRKIHVFSSSDLWIAIHELLSKCVDKNQIQMSEYYTSINK